MNHSLEYFAKSPSKDGHQETVKEHLEKVSELAETFGTPLGIPNAARISGILHDFGKYSQKFQNVLKGTEHHVDHAMPGAAFLISARIPQGIFETSFRPIVESINGHHDGLRPLDEIEGDLKEVLRKSPTHEIGNAGKHCSIPNQAAFMEAYSAMNADFPNLLKKLALQSVEKQPKSENDVDQMLFTRMLFSCLVDADYSASATIDDPDYMNRSKGEELDILNAEQKLDKYMAQIKSTSTANTIVDQVRNELYQDCDDAGETEDLLYTATAPTGAGKTLALMRFALSKCKTHGFKRIIVVLPFLSLAEQTEHEYRHIIPDLLVDHSQAHLDETQRDLTERWDTPCIITTSVNFFESLFAWRGPDCRKLHNIANSVVIFDEAQSLPSELTQTTVQAIHSLCRRFHTCVVLSTATQPDYGKINGVDWNPKEIVKNPESLYARMKRTEVEWRLEHPISLDEIATETLPLNQCCVIVNIRAHAKQILSNWGESDDTFLISTDLCPEHRKAVLSEVRRRLDDGLPCKVVATQCIEAGISIDFPVMYRALAPLPSIAQAAGRCNRHGKLPHLGKVVVFEPIPLEDNGKANRIYPGDWYQKASLVTKELFLDKGSNGMDIDDPKIINDYYARLFMDQHDKKELLSAIHNLSYENAEKHYKLINQSGAQIIVPYTEGNASEFQTIRAAVVKGTVSKKLLASTNGITVSSFVPKDISDDVCEPILMWNPHLNEMVPTGKYIVRAGKESVYDTKTGLTFPQANKKSIELLDV